MANSRIDHSKDKVYQKMKRLIAKEPNLNMKALAKKLNVPYGKVRRRMKWYQKEKGATRPKGGKVSKKNKPGVFDRSSLKSKYDHNTRIREGIREGLKTLTEDCDPEEDPIFDDAEFRTQKCDNAPTNGWRQIANEAEFQDYQFYIKNKVFWTTPRTKQWALDNISKARDL